MLYIRRPHVRRHRRRIPHPRPADPVQRRRAHARTLRRHGRSSAQRTATPVPRAPRQHLRRDRRRPPAHRGVRQRRPHSRSQRARHAARTRRRGDDHARSFRRLTMAERVILTIGTRKGLLVAESGKTRGKWTLRGPFGKGVAVYTTLVDTRGSKPRIYASSCNPFFGMKILRSNDLGKTFKETKSAPAFPKEDGRALANIWS